jgi:hypothetical protein
MLKNIVRMNNYIYIIYVCCDIISRDRLDGVEIEAQTRYPTRLYSFIRFLPVGGFEERRDNYRLDNRELCISEAYVISVSPNPTFNSGMIACCLQTGGTKAGIKTRFPTSDSYVPLNPPRYGDFKHRMDGRSWLPNGGRSTI